MHDVLRQRLLRRIESLPDDQVYQVLDYIEFLESKYAPARAVEASGLQKFAEGLEDQLRRRAVNPSTLREAFQLLSSADRILGDVARTGRELLDEFAPSPSSGGSSAPGAKSASTPAATPGSTAGSAHPDRSTSSTGTTASRSSSESAQPAAPRAERPSGSNP